MWAFKTGETTDKQINKHSSLCNIFAAQQKWNLLTQNLHNQGVRLVRLFLRRGGRFRGLSLLFQCRRFLWDITSQQSNTLTVRTEVWFKNKNIFYHLRFAVCMNQNSFYRCQKFGRHLIHSEFVDFIWSLLHGFLKNLELVQILPSHYYLDTKQIFFVGFQKAMKTCLKKLHFDHFDQH